MRQMMESGIGLDKEGAEIFKEKGEEIFGAGKWIASII